jgi:ABC-type transport system substrate-binding protein
VRKAINMAIDKKAIIDGVPDHRRGGKEPDSTDAMVL